MRRIDQAQSIPVPHSVANPQILEELVQLIRTPDLDYSEFCRVAEQEPFIGGRILRAARAIDIAYDGNIESLRHAIALIGLRRVESVLRSIGRELQIVIQSPN